MVSNAIKHGMVGLPEGKVTFRGFEENSMVIVQVIDSGSQLKQWQPGEEESGEGLGLSLIKNLIGDLGGKFTLRHVAEANRTNCTVAEVRFPLVRPRAVRGETNV